MFFAGINKNRSGAYLAWPVVTDLSGLDRTGTEGCVTRAGQSRKNRLFNTARRRTRWEDDGAGAGDGFLAVMRIPFTLLIGLALLCGCGQAPAITQPIQFNHKAHTAMGLQCNFCHQSVQTAAYATRPQTELCMTCHQAPVSASPEAEKVKQYGETGRAIPWEPIYEVASHVYFSHRRHVVAAEIACEVCHGDMGSMEVPMARPAVDLSMDFCLGCHARRGASQDCDACHR